jgi:predicted dehydrogenase
MEPVRLGIIGAGPIVEKKHLPALAEVPELDVRSICRRTPERLEQLATRFRVPGRHTDYRAILGDPMIEAVLIAAGPPVQRQIVEDAAAAGKHILVEKPLAETVAEARAMVDAARAAKVQFQVGFNKRFYFGYQRARRLIEAGDLGSPSGVNARFWFQGGRRDGLLHNGIHFFDLLRFLMGPVTSVFARRATRDGEAGGRGDTVAVSVAFGDAAVGTLLLSSLAAWDYENEHVDVVGSTHDVLSVDGGRQVRVFRRGEGRPVEVHENTLSVHWWSGHEEQGFIPQLRAFARRIREGGPPPGDHAAGGPDGIASLAVLEAVRRSVAEGVPVAVPAWNESE